MSSLSHVLFALRAHLVERHRLALENIADRQQLAVLRRSIKRPKLEGLDRIFWIAMVRALDTWRETLLIVKGVVARIETERKPLHLEPVHDLIATE